MRISPLCLLTSLSFGLALSSVVRAQEPSLEDLESLGENVETNAAAKAKNEAAASAIQPVSSPVDHPASDTAGMPVIDIRNSIKKISEPNLFAGAAPNPGTLRNLASGEAPEEYLVQEGDTLFDICDQLIDEPNYWPKLWAFNPTISNPHFVYPGMRLRFYAGDNESPPFLQVITEDDILPVAKNSIVESELVQEDISGMLMRSEIPENMTILDPKELDHLNVDSMFSTVGGGFKAENQPVLIPAFIVEEELEVIGRVVGGSAGSILLDKGQQVIIKNVTDLRIGTTYSVVRKGDKVKDASNSTIGLRYEFIAQLKVDTQDKSDEEVFKGAVLFNRLGIQPGDILVPYRSVKRTVPLRPSPEGKALEQSVVGFTDPNRYIGGRGDFVFIEQTEGKLKEKETYSIIQNVKAGASEFQKDLLPDTDSNVAHVYIVDVSGSAAVGYLTHDSYEVRLGDRLAP